MMSGSSQTVGSPNDQVDAPKQPEQEVELIPVGRQELNAWRRGFTPQAEIWNGRMAMLGVSAGLVLVLLVNGVRSLTTS